MGGEPFQDNDGAYKFFQPTLIENVNPSTELYYKLLTNLELPMIALNVYENLEDVEEFFCVKDSSSISRNFLDQVLVFTKDPNLPQFFQENVKNIL